MPLATYNEMLREAFHASEAVDAFDLHSDDPVSIEKWRDLVQAQYAANCSLTKFCEDNGYQIRRLCSPVTMEAGIDAHSTAGSN